MAALAQPLKFHSAARFPGDWTLYHISTDRDSFLWMRLKLMLPPGTKKEWGKKRSFTLHWNPFEARLAKNKDSFVLKENFPELYSLVLTHLDITHDRAWLEDYGYTIDRIKEEVARLSAARMSSTRVRNRVRTRLAREDKAEAEQ